MDSPKSQRLNDKNRSKSVEPKVQTGKQSLSRKVANDAISSEGGNMGASVYIADHIVVNISFNF